MRFRYFLILLVLLGLGLVTAAQAVTPEVASVFPSVRRQGWSGMLTITGTTFESGATVEVSGATVAVISATVESSTLIRALVAIGSSETAGLKDVTVINPGGDQATAAGIFQVVTPEAGPQYSVVHFDSQPWPNAIPPSLNQSGFNVSFEVTATTSISAANAGLTIYVEQGGATVETVAVPAANITQVSTTGLRVSATSVSTNLSTGSANVVLACEDYAGNAGVTTAQIMILQPLSGNTGVSKFKRGTAIAQNHLWRPGQNLVIQLNTTNLGYNVPAGRKRLIGMQFGRKIFEYVFNNAIEGHLNVTVPANFIHKYATGMSYMLVIDEQGRKLFDGKFAVVGSGF